MAKPATRGTRENVPPGIARNSLDRAVTTELAGLIRVPLSFGMDMNQWYRRVRIVVWTAGVALSVNALGWVLADIEAIRSLGNVQALLELAGDLSYGAFGLAILWAIFDPLRRRPTVPADSSGSRQV